MSQWWKSANTGCHMCARKTWDQGLDPICGLRQAEPDQCKVYYSKGELTVKGRPESKPGNRKTIQPGQGKFKIPKCKKQGPNTEGKKHKEQMLAQSCTR